MRSYIGDFRRHTLSPSLLIPLAILVTLSGGFGYTDSPSPVLATFVYFYENGFNLILFVGDEAGRPVPTATWHLTFVNQTLSNGSVLSRDFSLSATSNAAGIARITAYIPPANYSVSAAVTSDHGSLTESWIVSAEPEDVLRVGPNTIQPGRIGFLTTTGGLFTFYSDSKGGPPTGDQIRYALGTTPTAGGIAGPPTLSPPVNLGTMSGYVGVFPLALPGNVRSNQTTSVVVQVLSPNGTVVNSAEFSPALFPEVAGPTAQGARLISFVGGVLAALFFLIALVISFIGYGRDRVSGIIESVHVRPVTQQHLLLFRFLSMTTISTILSIGAVGIVALVLSHIWGIRLDLGFWAGVAGSLAAESCAVLGITFLFVRLVPSLELNVGFSLGSFAFCILGWGSILSVLGFTTASSNGGSVASMLVNPAELPSLSTMTFPIPGSAGAEGVSLGLAGAPEPAAVLSLILWAVVPLLIALVSARYRD